MADRDFKGVWIPRDIWLEESLGWTEKILLAEIDSFASKKCGCFASNDYFSKFLKLSKDRVSKLISELASAGYIEVELIYFPNTKQVEKRVITTIGYRRKQLEGIGEKADTPLGENAEDISTSSINPVIKKIREGIPTEPLFKPSEKSKKPTLEEISTFFDDSGFNKDPENFFNYWESVDWTMKNGRKIKNWKAAARLYVKQPWAPPAPPKKAPVQLCEHCGKPLFDEHCDNKDCPQYA